MSTYYGYRCGTCGVSSPHWLNHGERVLRDLHRLTPHLSAIRDGDSRGYIEVGVLGCYEKPSPIDFLIEHRGHALLLSDEYGGRHPLDEAEAEDAA